LIIGGLMFIYRGRNFKILWFYIFRHEYALWRFSYRCWFWLEFVCV